MEWRMGSLLQGALLRTLVTHFPSPYKKCKLNVKKKFALGRYTVSSKKGHPSARGTAGKRKEQAQNSKPQGAIWRKQIVPYTPLNQSPVH